MPEFLFLFWCCGLFTIARGVNGAALRFGLGFGWVNLSGLAPLVAARNFVYWHDPKILGLMIANIADSDGDFEKK